MVLVVEECGDKTMKPEKSKRIFSDESVSAFGAIHSTTYSVTGAERGGAIAVDMTWTMTMTMTMVYLIVEVTVEQTLRVSNDD